MTQSIEHTADAVEAILNKGLNYAMNNYNKNKINL